MFTFNGFGGGAPPANTSGGILGTSAPPVLGGKSGGFSFASSAPPVFGNAGISNVNLSGSQGAAVPLTATPVFGGGGGGMNHSGNAMRSAGVLSGGGASSAPSVSVAAATAPPPPPPAYAPAAPAVAVPVFGGDRSFGPTGPFSGGGGISTSTMSNASASNARNSTSVLVTPNQESKPSEISDGNQRSNAVFGGGVVPPQPRSRQQQQQQQQQHRKQDIKAAPATSTPFHNSLGASKNNDNSVLPRETNTSHFAASQEHLNHNNNSSSSSSGSVLGRSTPFGGAIGAGGASPAFSSSFNAAAPSIVPAMERSVGRDMSRSNSSSSSVLDGRGHPPIRGSMQAFSSANSSFSAPFGQLPALANDVSSKTGDKNTASSSRPATPAVTPPPPPAFGAPQTSRFAGTSTTPAVPSANAFGTSAPPPPAFANTNADRKETVTTGGSSGGIRGIPNTTTAAAPPPAFTASPFGAASAATVPSTTAIGTDTSRSAFGAPAPSHSATVAPVMPPPAVPSAFAGDHKPSVPTTAPPTSAFLLGGGESKPSTSTTTTTTTAGTTTSAFGSTPAGAATAPLAKSVFGAASGNSSAPPPEFRATTADGAHGGRGGGGGGAGDTSQHGREHGGHRGRVDRRRGRSPSPPCSAAGSRAAAEDRQTPSFAIPAPRHAQQQHQPPPQQHQQQMPTSVSRLEKLAVPTLPADEKQWSLAARVCKSFLLQLASSAAMGVSGSSASREAGTAEALEQAFFGVAGREGVSGDFGKTAGEMLAVWQTQVRPILAGGGKTGASTSSLPFPGEVWVALFALGTYLNTIVSTLVAPVGSAALASARADLVAYKAGLRDHPAEALTDACHYANELSELLQSVFQRGGEGDAPPYSVLPVVLRRVRTVFDEANARGVATVQSNLNAVTSKLFAVLNRRVKAAAVQLVPSSATAEKAPRWLLTYDSREKESMVHSFAYLVSEMIAVDAPMNEDVELFVAAFHESLPSALAERCMLYYRRACALLRQPLRMRQVQEAAELLARALAVYPPDAPPQNKRVLEVKLLTAELALGRLPSDQDRIALDVPQLIDVVNALKTSRLDLLDAALKMHGPFFVQIGVHNALLLARQRIALLMVVKYYVTHGCENRLAVQEMVRYHHLPYSSSEAGTVWLLPLLVEKAMNGVLDHGILILSGKAPFDEYPRELLDSAAGL